MAISSWGVAPPWQVCLAAVFCGAAALGYGRCLARMLRLPGEPSFAFLMGAPILSLLVMMAGLAQRLSVGIMVAIGLVGVAAGIPYSFRWRLPMPPWWCRIAAGAYTVLYLANALAPEISPDGLMYHVNRPRRYWEAGGIVPILTTIYAQMPQGLEMLFTFVYPLGGGAAAALVHSFFLAALAVMVWHEAGPAKAWATALLVCCTPVIGIDAASAYNDVALTATAFAAFIAARRWHQTNLTSWLFVASLLAGFAFAIKYTGALAILMVLVIAWLAFRKPRLWPALLLPATLQVSVWLGKNYAFTGNPLSPFWNGWFDNPVFDAREEAGYLAQLPWTGTLPDLVANVLLRGEHVGGLLGPVFYLVPLLIAFGVWRAEARPYLAAGLLWVLPFAANAGTRFLIPAIPFLAIATARITPQRGLVALAVFHAILSWPAAMDHYTYPWAWRLKEIPWRRDWTGFGVLRPLDGRRDRVLTLSAFHDALSTAHLIDATSSRQAQDLGIALWEAASPKRLPLSRVRFWFPTQRLESVRLRKTAGESVALARVTFFDLLTPIQPTPGWRATASKNPYFAASVLDGSLLTRWYSSTAPGEEVSFEIRFDRPLAFNRLDVELESTDPLPPIQLEGLSVGGQWQILRNDGELASEPETAGDRRVAALDLLHRNGIGFVLVQNRDRRHEIRAFDEAFEAPPFRYERVAADGSARLYQIIRSVGPEAKTSILGPVGGKIGAAPNHAEAMRRNHLRPGW